MRLIGVIDLKGHRAVHAHGGQRDAYEPVSAAAGAIIDGNPLTLARLYRDAFGLTEIYVADLDAIGTAARPEDVVGDIAGLGVHVWLDAGVRTTADIARVGVTGARTIVVGLETLESLDDLGDISRNGSGQSVAFSLDLRDGRPISAVREIARQSPEEICRRAIDAGVSTVIVLDLARVGRGTGPDCELLRRIRDAVPAVSVFAGGGVRDITDLRQLAAEGCEGALVATALQNGQLTPADSAAAFSF